MTFNLELSVTEIILLSAIFAVSIFITTLYRRRITRVVRHKALLDAAAVEIAPELLPPLSVIVYTRDNAEDLARMLPDVLGQDYPAGIEVIVVNDGSSESTKDVVNRLSIDHRNLRLTFIPDEAHNLSRRKLAITLGIKAARNEVVVITAAEVSIPSRRWLSAIGRHFVSGKSVVIGHATFYHTGSTRSIYVLDETAETAAYLGAAGSRRPFRGNSYNIAYRKELFFNNKGFARSLNLHGGDDDIFINEITDADNCTAELTADGSVRLCFGNRDAAYREQKLSHLFTSRFLPKTERRFTASGPLLLWATIAASAATAAVSWPNMLPLAAAVIMLLVQWAVMTAAWSKTAHTLSLKLKTYKIPLLLLRMPLHNMRYRIRARRNTSRNYTWTHKRK